MKIFTVLGDPRPQLRHRLGSGRTWDPSAKDKARFRQQLPPGPPSEGALEINLIFYFSRPLSHYGTGKNAQTLKKSAPEHKISTPDIDNLCKFVLDACNGRLFRDDCQIIEITAVKRWTTTDPRTVVKLHQIPESTKMKIDLITKTAILNYLHGLNPSTPDPDWKLIARDLASAVMIGRTVTVTGKGTDAEVMKILPDGEFHVRFEDGTEGFYSLDEIEL